jgi:hypothetical protein
LYNDPKCKFNKDEGFNIFHRLLVGIHDFLFNVCKFKDEGFNTFHGLLVKNYGGLYFKF